MAHTYFRLNLVLVNFDDFSESLEEESELLDDWALKNERDKEGILDRDWSFLEEDFLNKFKFGFASAPG